MIGINQTKYLEEKNQTNIIMGFWSFWSRMLFFMNNYSFQRQTMIHLWVRQLQPYTCCLGMHPAFWICSSFSDFRGLKQFRHKWDFTDISNNFYNTAWKSFLTWKPDWTYSTASAGQKARWSVVFHSLTQLLQIQVLEDWFNMEV